MATPARRAVDAVTLSIPAGTRRHWSALRLRKDDVADLVIGLLRPTSGRVTIDDVELNGDRAPEWRRRIGYVAQDAFFFHDTVRANLRWAAPATSDADIEKALRNAAAEFVLTLPQGLDTLIGDRGTRLSGGERQRLGARAGASAPARTPGPRRSDERARPRQRA